MESKPGQGRDTQGGCLLLDQGAHINEQDKHTGETALAAAKIGNLEVATRLIENGAGVNAKGTDKWSALMYAAANRNV